MSLATAILQTLKYSDHFDFPLPIKELHTRLIGHETTRAILIQNLAILRKKNQVEQTGSYYHLPGRQTLVAHRLTRAKLSIPQLALAKNRSSQLSFIPGVLAIYLTGSLAMTNSGADSDIDLMIVTRPHKLWTTRLLLTLFTTLLGLRRTPYSTRNSGKLCLNLYLTPHSYLLPPHKRSLYTAYELIQAVPLYDPHDTRSSLLAANPWIRDFLPNFPLPTTTPSTIDHGRSAINLFERLAYHLQLLYMRPRLTREYITPDSAFFHPHDKSPKVE